MLKRLFGIVDSTGTLNLPSEMCVCENERSKCKMNFSPFGAKRDWFNKHLTRISNSNGWYDSIPQRAYTYLCRTVSIQISYVRRWHISADRVHGANGAWLAYQPFHYCAWSECWSNICSALRSLPAARCLAHNLPFKNKTETKSERHWRRRLRLLKQTENPRLCFNTLIYGRFADRVCSAQRQATQNKSKTISEMLSRSRLPRIDFRIPYDANARMWLPSYNIHSIHVNAFFRWCKRKNK